MQDKDQRRISTATTSSQTNNMPNQPHHQRQEQEQSKRLKLDPTNHLTPSHPIQQDDRERNLLPENHHANIYSNQDQTSLDPANYHPSSQSQYPSSLIPDHDDQNQLTSLDGEDVSVEPLELTFSWKNSTFQVSLEGMVSIKDLKAVIYSVTSVPPERQKILGLVVGQIPADHVLLSTLEFKLKKGVHFMLLGSPEEESMIRPSGDTSTQLDQSGSAIPKSRNSNSVLYMSRVRAKLDELSANLELNIMNPPRAGKKLLVLDLDYTLMDSKAYSDYSVHALDMARPYLHEFLTALWPYYDICIWSATSWRWLESKLVELGMVDGSRSNQYLIQFVLDRRTMFEVTSMRHGKISKHEVKALELIWRKVPEYNETNTVHLDDLSRNFALNPKSGVKISAFKHARANKQDRQLIFLARYFLQISALDDVTSVDHKKWQDCQLPLPEEIRDPLEILDPSDPELAKFKSHHSKPS